MSRAGFKPASEADEAYGLTKPSTSLYSPPGMFDPKHIFIAFFSFFIRVALKD